MNEIKMTGKIGVFYISDRTMLTEPDLVKLMLRDMLILRCEFLYHIRSFEYVAISDLFEEKRVGEKTPEYQLYINDGVVCAR